MRTKEPSYDVGVIIGRFQLHDLHDAHQELIQHVCDEHNKVLVLLGVSPLSVSSYNPLDFEARKQMILEEFPHVSVLFVRDQPTDEAWSKKVDDLVGDFVTPGQTTVLYGSRDSFIAHYTGSYPVRELISDTILSGTAVRREIARSGTRATADFRAGVIWAANARFKTAFQTVDVAILDENSRILLGRKQNERLFRFIGGFSDPESNSLEDDVRREVFEEAGIEVGDITYIGSTRIDDWRYQREPDCIKTALFTAKYTFGRPTPGDDIEEVRWFSLDDLTTKAVVPTHRPLVAMMREARKAAQ